MPNEALRAVPGCIAVVLILSLFSSSATNLNADETLAVVVDDIFPVNLKTSVSSVSYGSFENFPSGIQSVVAAVATNNMEVDLPIVTVIFEARDSDGVTNFVSWQSGGIRTHEQTEFRVSWIPPGVGMYEFRTFAITDFDSPQILSSVKSTTASIIQSGDEISDMILLNRTKDLEEVKAILGIHDDPHIVVDRSLGLDIEYHISTTQFEGKPYDPGKDCLFMKFRMLPNGTFDLVVDSNGSNQFELGDEIQLEFLNMSAGCQFAQIRAIPESVLVKRTKDFEEVRVFLERYPSAKVWIDRQGAVVIGYSITRAEVTGERWNKPDVSEPSAGITLQFDRHLELQTLGFSCIYDTGSNDARSFHVDEDEIVEYLRNENHCWDDERFVRERELPGEGMRAVTFDDDPWLTRPVGCMDKDPFEIYACQDPAHSEWLRAQGIIIIGTPHGVVYTTNIVGTWHTRVVLGFSTLDPEGQSNTGGLGKNETLAIHFVNGPTDFVSIRMTSAPSDDDLYNNVQSNAVLTAYDAIGNVLTERIKNFTSVTNRTYTPGDIAVSANDTNGRGIDYVTLQVTQHPHDGIYIERITFTDPAVTVSDSPPVITVPTYRGAAREIYDEPGAEVEYDVYAYDDKDGTVKPSCNPSSGSFFSVGNSTVLCSAKDSHGNEANATFVVTIVDRAVEVFERFANFRPVDGTAVENRVMYELVSNLGGVAVNPVTNLVYVSDTNNNTISVIDADSKKVVAKIPTFWNPLSVAVNPFTNTVYVSAGKIFVIDGQNNKIITKVEDAGNSHSDIAVNTRTNRVYLADPGTNTVHIIDGATNRVSGAFTTGGGAYGIAVDSDANIIYVSNRNWNPDSKNINTISVVNGTNNMVIGTIKVGADPFDVAVNAKTNMIYTTNFADNTVSVIDGTSLEVVATVPVGTQPQGIAIDPLSNRIYVAADSVYVIDGSTNDVVGIIRIDADRVDLNHLTKTLFLTSWGSSTAQSVDLVEESLENPN